MNRRWLLGAMAAPLVLAVVSIVPGCITACSEEGLCSEERLDEQDPPTTDDPPPKNEDGGATRICTDPDCEVGCTLPECKIVL